MIKEEIIKLLNSQNIKFTLSEHEEVRTSEEASQVRGTRIEEGAKALILKGKTSGNNILVVVPGNKKVNFAALKELLGEKFEMESPDKILEKWNIKVGGVPPFGNILNIPTYMDNRILDNEKVTFNCGLRTSSIDMKSEDLVKVVNGLIGNYSL